MTGARRKILVIEDEEPIRSLVETILGGAGYDVVSTGDPTQAAELARRSTATGC